MTEISTDKYVELLTGCQHRLYGYIYSLTANSDQAGEVLQETNRRLWQLKDKYDAKRSFIPWALKVAYNQVRTARKKFQRERLVFQEEATLHAIAGDQSRWNDRLDERVVALESCLGKLSSNHRYLVQEYYQGDVTIESLAKTMNSRANSIAVVLHRIRQSLADCIRRKMG